ncbi:hypothetical protein MMAGJ_33890 [Mycolicibacterium mageritense]|uniref:Uncharacterized protein n=1 Tax=Mycolicibacterium mageritense TaxID=53462 RepID=A0ABM7HU57_MYCME|nr:hypothetical protein MMAGJ_33890 [Mycolicibacterium mageritense]
MPVGDGGRAAVYPAQCALFFEECQVTPHRLGRDSEQADQLIGADRLGGADRFDDRLMPLNWQHD